MQEVINIHIKELNLKNNSRTLSKGSHYKSWILICKTTTTTFTISIQYFRQQLLYFNAVPENNISNSSIALVEDPIQINLMTSQFAASTITYNTLFVVSNNIQRNYGQNNYNCNAGGTSEVVNDSYFVSNNKVVKYHFQVIQSLQNRFTLDDETTTEQHCSDTTNDDSSTITHEGDSTSTTITNELYCKWELQGNVTHNCT
ncbi:hypothetical protein DEO72_LG3g169 [Vigna unguiculata]|uniref:Uncharacterized protein n=1 Tax=Vigna unguiculata TaxID=3917 RepID=A0A4D6LAU5_VIGUN|nr:hypothetical protein DEO72_LG3g169 [Vigna unguiculata]